MDTTNCSFGFATDISFRNGIFKTCQVPLLAVDLSFTFALLFRFITLAFVWNQWIKTRAKWTKKHENSPFEIVNRLAWEKRIPIVPTLSGVVFLDWVLLAAFVRFNLISANDGFSLFLWTFGFLGFGIYSQIHQRKMVHLARRLSPFLLTDDHYSFIERFDFVLKILIIIEQITLIGQTACGILGLILTNNFMIMQICFALQGIYMFALVTSIGYQLYRVSRVLRQSTIQKKDTNSARQKINLQNSYFLSVGYAGAVINYLLAANVIPSSWGILIYGFLIETLASSHAFVETVSRYMKMKKDKTPIDTASGRIVIENIRTTE